MMVRKFRLAAAAGIVLLAAGTLSVLGAATLQQDPKMQENISTLLLLRMTAALDLTDEQTAKIFPRVHAVEKEKASINREIAREMRSLRLLVDGRVPNDQAIVDKIKDIRSMRDRVRELDEDLEAFLDENLTPLQQGKYIFFAQEFYRSLREQLNRARNLQKRRSGPLRP